MEMWICDEFVNNRWADWINQTPPAWTACLIKQPGAVPSNSKPALLVIHHGNGWTWGIPAKYPEARVIRYSAASRELSLYGNPPQPFCSLNHLQSNLLPILEKWDVSRADATWIWTILEKRGVLEVGLELLYELLPAALDNLSADDLPESSAWKSLELYVTEYSAHPAVTERFEETRAAYERCIGQKGDYVINLSKLRDCLLGNGDFDGLVEVIENAKTLMVEKE